MGDNGPKEAFIRKVAEGVRDKGYPVLIVECGVGESFGPMTMSCLNKMQIMVCFMYEDYGERTHSCYCSYYEVQYAMEHHLPMIPLKLYPGKPWPPEPQREGEPDELAIAQNNFAFGPSLVRKQFDPNKDTDACVDFICERYKALCPPTVTLDLKVQVSGSSAGQTVGVQVIACNSQATQACAAPDAKGDAPNCGAYQLALANDVIVPLADAQSPNDRMEVQEKNRFPYVGLARLETKDRENNDDFVRIPQHQLEGSPPVWRPSSCLPCIAPQSCDVSEKKFPSRPQKDELTLLAL